MAVKSNGNNNPIISVAVIARNSRDDLHRLFSSLASPLSNISHELILIDNASIDKTDEMIRSEFPNVKITKNSVNRGVAPARNQALRQCVGEYVFILDADCEFREGDLRQAINYLEKNNDIGVLGFRVYYPDGKLQDTARTLPSLKDLIINRLDDSNKIKNSKAFRRHRMRDFDPMKPREAGFVAGACQFFRRKLLDEVGYLDEKMFYGYEDSDFCARVIQKGKKVIYFPYIVVVHHHQRLTKKNPMSKMTLIQMRSYWIFYRRHGNRIGQINRELFKNNLAPTHIE